ncbi:MAG TPA: hypothetical protein DCE09_01740 [Thermoanaerobacter sp.]|nr:hypothetical protein [Thermoanaerobacter sp.]
MRKVITMVGTSIFDNYREENTSDTLFKRYIEDLKDKGESEYGEEIRRIRDIKNKIAKWINEKKLEDKVDISAEVKSLIKLKEELKEELEIYLLCSDTLLSIVAGEIIEEFIEDNEEMFNTQADRVKKEIIKDLQVSNREKFEDGMNRLVNKMYEISNDFWENVVVNVTGGFKATIPFLTILSQVNKCPVYYIFEKTDVLIKIPNIPINVNWNVFEEHEKLFLDIEKEGIKKLSEGLKDIADIKAIVEYTGDLISFNPLGLTLWKKYKERFELFYISPIVKEFIERKENKLVVDNSLMELKRRLLNNPDHPDLDHKLHGIDLKGFKCFKHKERNLQVRIIYTTERWETSYGSEELNIYIGDIAIGSEVHNAESEYIKQFANNLSKIENLSSYEIYRIDKIVPKEEY